MYSNSLIVIGELHLFDGLRNRTVLAKPPLDKLGDGAYSVIISMLGISYHIMTILLYGGSVLSLNYL